MQTTIGSQINLSHYMLGESTLKIMMPGDLITRQEGFMHGHGTYQENGGIYSSLLGTVQKTNKLITVNPLHCCYSPQIGDIVVGRVIKITNRRWKIDINASSHAILNLNSTYFPQHRKKNQDDQLNMRNILAQDDLLVAEVHSLNNDRTVNLHTRNAKYGRLQPGVLVEVDHKLIKRQKHHMVQLNEVSVIMSNNGQIWLSNLRRNESLEAFGVRVRREEYTLEEVRAVGLLNNVIRVLDWNKMEISEERLLQLLQYCTERKFQPVDVLYNGVLSEYLKGVVQEGIPTRITQASKGITYQ